VEVMAVSEAVIFCRFYTADFVMQASYVGKEKNYFTFDLNFVTKLLFRFFYFLHIPNWMQQN
jgi:hypothetical protein